MKSVLIVGMLVLAAPAGFAQRPDDKVAANKTAADKPVQKAADYQAALDKAILAAEQSWRDAELKHDSDALQHVLRSDFIGIDITGRLWNAHQLIEAYDAAPKTTDLKPLVNAMRARFFGDNTVAVVTGAETTAGPKGYFARFTRVWVKSNDGWQLSNSQLTRDTEMAPKSPKPIIVKP